ncbi:MAG: superoxide dismutase [Blastocatellia bacterium]|jgi:Fe-Mn family superoxide dismutase|nr:superoxide dismutase [Blastocatellia bacterium]MBK6427050.1 superoxide dismutase [Blastocatellia bacterium]
MANLSGQPYPERQFNLSGLNGITDKQLEQHYKLYAGYVANTNKLNEQLAELIKAGDTLSPKFGELTRRMGFEYNGMRLHEYYFENMTSSSGTLEAGSKLGTALAGCFGDIETWRTDFTSIGKMRGVGWAVLALDPLSGKLSNHWITLHEEGNVVGFAPILVMDVWEHAYTVDYLPTERAKYIDAFCSNIDWSVCEGRLP